MKVLLWHVHGSWTTSFVQGRHEHLLPLLPDRGPDGRGRARTWDWPASAREVPVADLAAERPDAVLLQRPHEAELLHRWTGLRAGVDVPAVYVEHNAPPEHAARTVHPLADGLPAELGGALVPVVHVTAFNAVMWDGGRAPVRVVEHGVVDPGYAWTGERASLAVVVNEPVRRWRVAGTDLLLRVSRDVDVDVHGMGMAALLERAPHLAGRVHEDLPQAQLHARLAAHRGYFHPYRWTSLGLALVEAMTAGLPVLALATTAAPESVPAAAGLVSNDVDALVATARRWMADPAEARERGLAGREHALVRFGLGRFLADWDAVLHEVASGAAAEAVQR
ncbi:glycosyltransferase [Quadrisphaera sp. DSM 44207]|uniref:glycosyltransferase n=1 Tax=Quadrisphaera sp. DSM 44207 TaxID=1881057 RepID=UPI0008827DE9|nr:glycosyltransferase [Quadrisphaera sp. DSM 44207]SDQ04055.1 Glycosyl transferases group 1 [Quadrisphaera sp. DSM 44207]